jgi:hypothetical protein
VVARLRATPLPRHSARKPLPASPGRRLAALPSLPTAALSPVRRDHRPFVKQIRAQAQLRDVRLNRLQVAGTEKIPRKSDFFVSLAGLEMKRAREK